MDARPTKIGLEVKVRDKKLAHLVRMCAAEVNLRALMAEVVKEGERQLRRYSGFMQGDANTRLTREAMQLLVDGQMHLRGIEGRILDNRLFRTEKGCILWLCVDLEAEEGMARIDSTISLGFAGRVRTRQWDKAWLRFWRSRGSDFSKSSASCLTSSRKLAQRSWQSYIVRLTHVISQLTEGVSNSSIVPTAPLSADTGAGNGNLEMNSQAPAVSPANTGCVVEQTEAECTSPQ